VSHSNFISRFSILEDKWVSHMKFDNEVVAVKRTLGKKKKNLKKSMTKKDVEKAAKSNGDSSEIK